MDYSRPLIYQKNTRSHTASGTNINNNNSYSNYLACESSSNDFAIRGDTANDSATDTGTERRSLRRRTANSRNGPVNGTDVDVSTYGSSYYLLGDVTEESDIRSQYSSAGDKRYGNSSSNNNSTKRGKNSSGNQSDINSDADFLQGISDYEDLQILLFGEKGIEKTTINSNKKKHRINPRYSTKAAPPLESLTPDEVTRDIALIRDLTAQSPAPFKVRNPPAE